MTRMYLEDFKVGEIFGSVRLNVTAEEIIRFATQFDPQPFHLDPEAAKTPFFADWLQVAGTQRR